MPAVEYNLPSQFITRLNFGGIEKFSVSPQSDLLVVGSATQICLFTTADYTLNWCTLTMPEIGMVTPEGASDRSKVIKMVFREDGQQLAVALWNGYIIIFDTKNGDLVTAIETKHANVNNLVWSADNTQILVYSRDGGIDVWDTETGNFVKQLNIDLEASNNNAWSSEGSLFASIEYRGKIITIWDVVQAVPTSTIDIQSDGFVSSMAFSPDLKTLYAGIATPFPCEENCDDKDPEYKGWITAYDIESGTLVDKAFVGDAIARLAISPDGNSVAAGGGIFGSLVVLVNQFGRVNVKFINTHADAGLGWLDNSRVLYLPDPQHIDAMSISQWDTLWTEHTEIYLPGFETIGSLAWTPDSERLITNAPGGMISLWQAHTGQKLEQFQLMIAGIPVTKFEPAWISPVADLLAVAAQNSIALIDFDTRQVVRWLNHADIAKSVNAFNFTWSKDGQKIMAEIVDTDHPGKISVAVWEIGTGKRLLTIPGEFEVSFYGLAFSPDGERIALSRTLREAEFKHQLVTLDMKTGKELQVLDLTTNTMHLFWMTPDQIVFDYCGKTHIWNLTNGSEREIAGATGNSAFRADGSLAASPCFGVGINIWDLHTGKEIKCLEIPADSFGYKSLSFNPDGRLLASLTDNGSVLLWDMSESDSP